MRFKYIKDIIRFSFLNPLLQQIAIDMLYYAENNHYVELTITSTFTSKEEDEKVKRISTTHRTGRAFDVSIRDVASNVIDDIRHYLEHKYGEFGAITKDGEKKLVVYHPHGTAPHLHIQIHSQYSIPKEDLNDIKKTITSKEAKD